MSLNPLIDKSFSLIRSKYPPVRFKTKGSGGFAVIKTKKIREESFNIEDFIL